MLIAHWSLQRTLGRKGSRFQSSRSLCSCLVSTRHRNPSQETPLRSKVADDIFVSSRLTPDTIDAPRGAIETSEPDRASTTCPRSVRQFPCLTLAARPVTPVRLVLTCIARRTGWKSLKSSKTCALVPGLASRHRRRIRSTDLTRGVFDRFFIGPSRARDAQQRVPVASEPSVAEAFRAAEGAACVWRAG
eukprot:766124-Hanusia_phi.AAC.1